MSTERTIPAGQARPGRQYLTPRKTPIKVLGQVEGSTDVQVENEHGRRFTVTDAYPLIPVGDDGPNLEALAGGPLEAIRAALAELGPDDLDALEDLDPRPEVLELTEARRAELEGASAPERATCPACAQAVALMAGRGSKVLAVHQDADGRYCKGSGTDPKAKPAPAPFPPPPPSRPRPPWPRTRPSSRTTGTRTAPRPPTWRPGPPWPSSRTWGTTPAPAELEGETLTEPPESTDPWRHLAGAESTADRIEAIRRVQLSRHLDELETIRAELQAKAARELDRHRKALDAIGDAIRAALEDGNQADLKRLADRQDYQARPGVMARARAAFAVLHGRGEPVDHGIQPVAPSELEGPPASLTAEDAPEDLAEVVAFLASSTGRPVVPGETAATVARLAGTVRESRAAIPGVEDVNLVRLAFAFESSRAEPRETVLDQLRGRIQALGGEVPEPEDPRQLKIGQAVPAEPSHVPCETEGCDGSGYDCDDPGTADTAKARALELVAEAAGNGEGRPRAFMLGREVEPCPFEAGTLEAELWALGRADFDALVADGLIRPASVSELEADLAAEVEATRADLEAEAELQAEPPPWDLSRLPLPDQVARASLARALELAPTLSALDAAAAGAAERERDSGPRAQVLEALAERLDKLAALEAASAPARELPEDLEAAGPETVEPSAPRPAPTPPAIQVRDLRRVDQPDGRVELWAVREGPDGFRLRLGAYDDPRLAVHRAHLERHQAETRAQVKPAWTPAAGPTAVQVAQAALASLAQGLPALAALGIEVEIKITTKAQPAAGPVALAD